MDKLVIIHFLPLENYPPVMNLTRLLSDQQRHQGPITILTTKGYRPKKTFSASGIRIRRLATWKANINSFERGWLYLKFNARAIWNLIRIRPKKILYVETLSSFPVSVYANLFPGKAQIYIHYHEYTSIPEYLKGMMLSRFFHQLELKLYKKATWVSHTNHDRGGLFMKDLGVYAPSNMYTLSNYPPSSWIQQSRASDQRTPIRFVYVGALSLETMYVKQWAKFISAHPEMFSWDIYSDNHTREAMSWISELNASNIFFKGGVDYDELSKILPEYDVGLILYNGHIPNYIYNAPNKLFEYHACGLDTFFPVIMKGCEPYITKNTFPVIIQLDFEKLDTAVVVQSLNKSGLQYRPSPYFCEKNLRVLTDQLLENV